MTKERGELIPHAVHKTWFHLLELTAEQYGMDTLRMSPDYSNALQNNKLDVCLLRKLLYAMVEQSGDRLLPTKATQHIQPLSFGCFSLVLWTAPNLYTQMQRCAEYSVVFGSPVRVIFKETVMGNGEYWFIDNTPYDPLSTVSHVGMMMIIATMIRFALNTTTEPDIEFEIHLTKDKFPHDVQQSIIQALNCQIHYNAPINKVSIARRFLFSRLNESNSELHNANLKLLCKEAASIASSNVILQVYKVFNEASNLSMLSGDSLARSLNLTSRTLNRRLSDAGTSYRDLINKYRLEKAMHLLHNPDISMTEISYQLGFSDLSTFSRAFKRWTGTCPSQINVER